MPEILNIRSPGLDVISVSEIGNIPMILLPRKIVSASTFALTSAVFVLGTTTGVGHPTILLRILNIMSSQCNRGVDTARDPDRDESFAQRDDREADGPK